MFFNKLNKASGVAKQKNHPQNSTSLTKTKYTTTTTKVVKDENELPLSRSHGNNLLSSPSRPSRHSSEPITSKKSKIIRRVRKTNTIVSSPVSSEEEVAQQRTPSARKRKTPKSFNIKLSDSSSEDEENWQLNIKKPSSASITATQSPASESDFDNDQSSREFYYGGPTTADIISSADLIKSNSKSIKYKSLFDDNNHNITLELPFGQEEYSLLIPSKPEETNPIDEIISVFELVATAFVPRYECDISGVPTIPSYLIKHPSNQDCILRRLRRAMKNNDSQLFYTSVDEFNQLIISLRTSGEIKSTITSLTNLPTPVIYELLNQVYRRVVSPRTQELRQYEAFSSNVYGELLPKFVTEIFKKTRLIPTSSFIDLGSGVGNCVLQAALEIGCRSWGCEMMKTASELATKQKHELQNRCESLYRLSLGEMNVVSADFVSDPEILAALNQADVVLVNNYAFDAKLNSQLVDMFLDLKDGCRVVSLRSFVPAGHVITEHNRESPINILRVEKHHFSNDSVSWTTAGGDYYIATVDRSRLSM